MPSLHDRVAAIGAELDELREEALLANDLEVLPALKEASCLFGRHFDHGTSGNSYQALKERVGRELHLNYARDLETIQRQHGQFTGELLAELEERTSELEREHERRVEAEAELRSLSEALTEAMTVQSCAASPFRCAGPTVSAPSPWGEL